MMKINVVPGTGFGPTELAAADAAMLAAGVGNRNIIRLSSVIPPGAEVVALDKPDGEAAGRWGDRLYCVLAEQRTSHHGTEVWAGIGWVQFEGKGLFVEHEGHSETAVARKIRSTLMALMKNRGMEPDESLIGMKLAGATCHDQPACAMVVAAYSAEQW